MTDLSELMDRATREVAVPTSDIVAGALARGGRLRRRRRAAVGAGSLAAVAVLGVGSVWVARWSGTSAGPVVPAVSTSPSVSAAATPSEGPTQLQDLDRGIYAGATETPLTKDADQIHQAISEMLPAGAVGPILTPAAKYPKVSRGADRVESFMYIDPAGGRASYLDLTIHVAKGQPTCESLAAAAKPGAGFSRCETVGDSKVITEQSTGPRALNLVMAWRHGYAITVTSGPDPMKDVATGPLLPLDVLTQIATSSAWFE